MSIESEALKIVEEALAFEDRAERAAFLAERCDGNAALATRVDELLARDATDFRLFSTESFIRPLGLIDDIPERIGPYCVTGEIARGGMGAVVRAERDDGVFQRTVAIKLIRADLASERARRRFADERRILARLHHPAIVRILDGGAVDERAWLAMDFVDGQAITTPLAGADDDARLDAFAAVCEAVAYAHRNLVIHADIKPSNVLMSADGAVHLLDFGIARLIVDLDEAEAGDPYPLTKGYAAPERAVGVMPTIASDVFSLGVLLLGVLGLAVPEENGDFVPGTRLPKNALRGDLAAIAAKALAEAPSDRYPDVPALMADMRRYRGSEPVEARVAPGWRHLAGLFVRRNRRPLLLGAVVALGLVAATTASTINYVRAERERAEADKRFVELRSLADFMLTELDDRLSDAPGTVGARARLAEVAGRYLDRLRAVPGAPLDLRLDTARGYRRLASIQGLSGTANLGRPDEAARSLDRAQAILENLLHSAPENMDVASELGWVMLARWVQSADTKGGQPLDRAFRLFDAVLARNPSDPSARLGRITAEKDRAFDLTTADRPKEALAAARSALAKLRAQPWPQGLQREAQLLEVNLLNRIGDALYYGGDVSGSLSPYREGETIIRRNLARAPSLVWEEKLGEEAFNISGTLGGLGGQDAAALGIAESGISEMRRTLSFGPDAAIEMRMLILMGEQSLLLDAMGRTGEAAKVSRDRMALYEARLVRSPANLVVQRDLMVGLAAHADILAKAGAEAEACAATERGVALIETMKRGGNLGARDIRVELPKLQAARVRHCGNN